MQLAARTPGERGAHLEPGREDQAVDFVLDAVRHDAVLGEALDPLAVGVDERDVRPVVGVEVLVVEARALAELPVVRLERFGGAGVFDELLDA